MTIDAPTMLLLSLGIAAIAAWFLGMEGRALREKSLALWAAGFGAIVIGCGLSPLREGHSFLVGIWVANGLLVVAHLLFLAGSARFSGRRVSLWWCALLLPWSSLLWLPAGEARTLTFGALNSALVAILALRIAALHLPGGRRELDGAPARLGLVFLVHGLWYCLKTGLIFAHGAYEMARFQGFAIQLSLFEGIMVEVLLALCMAAAVRRRRENEIAKAAERDPLTSVFNRRAFQQRAAALLGYADSAGSRGALMLLDLDGFKAVNDRFGHAFGDRVLLALTEVVTSLLPESALFARLGGDEFVLLLPDMAEAAANALGQAICAAFACSGSAPLSAAETVTVSIGAAIYGGEVPLAELMSNADGALYEAKRHGRDRLCWHGASPGCPAFRGALTAA